MITNEDRFRLSIQDALETLTVCLDDLQAGLKMDDLPAWEMLGQTAEIAANEVAIAIEMIYAALRLYQQQVLIDAGFSLVERQEKQ